MGFLTTRRPTNTSSLSSFQSEMNRLMEDFFSDSWTRFPQLSDTSLRTTQWSPRVNVSETEKEYKVTAELPGLEQKDIELSFDDNALFLRGERRFEKETEEENFHHVEMSFGSFQRVIPFNRAVDQEKISANFDKGVLTVRLEKTSKTPNKGRKIEIK